MGKSVQIALSTKEAMIVRYLTNVPIPENHSPQPLPSLIL